MAANVLKLPMSLVRQSLIKTDNLTIVSLTYFAKFHAKFQKRNQFNVFYAFQKEGRIKKQLVALSLPLHTGRSDFGVVHLG